MPLLLPSILANPPRAQQPFVLLQSSLAQSSLPILKSLLSQSLAKGRVLLLCFLHPPSVLLNHTSLKSPKLHVLDWTNRIPGYGDDWSDPETDIIDAVNQGTSESEPINIVIDSADTLLSNYGSLSKTYGLLARLFALVHSRGASSRLIVHVVAPSPLIPLLAQTRFSSSLAHLKAHPVALLSHLSTAYLMPPPPLSAPEKFWAVFIPFTERHYESEKLVFGPGGEGSGGDEIVVEVLVRGADGSGRRRGVERVLEGWVASNGTPCELEKLESLRNLWTRKILEEAAPDHAQNVSFNLNLTLEQQQSRAQVPLPYAHEGKSRATSTAPVTGAILYEPDSADDIDDDDPDEDLDI